MEDKSVVHNLIDRLDAFAVRMRALATEAEELSRELFNAQCEIILVEELKGHEKEFF